MSHEKMKKLGEDNIKAFLKKTGREEGCFTHLFEK
jgi:hypothetical protein